MARSGVRVRKVAGCAAGSENAEPQRVTMRREGGLTREKPGDDIEYRIRRPGRASRGRASSSRRRRRSIAIRGRPDLPLLRVGRADPSGVDLKRAVGFGPRRLDPEGRGALRHVRLDAAAGARRGIRRPSRRGRRRLARRRASRGGRVHRRRRSRGHRDPSVAARRARLGHWASPRYLSRSAPARTACAAASRATGTRNGEHET